MTGAINEINFCTVSVDMNRCTLCLKCISACPNGALSFDKDVVVFMHSAYECNYEKECEEVCSENAITILEM